MNVIVPLDILLDRSLSSLCYIWSPILCSVSYYLLLTTIVCYYTRDKNSVEKTHSYGCHEAITAYLSKCVFNQNFCLQCDPDFIFSFRQSTSYSFRHSSLTTPSLPDKEPSGSLTPAPASHSPVSDDGTSVSPADVLHQTFDIQYDDGGVYDFKKRAPLAVNVLSKKQKLRSRNKFHSDDYPDAKDFDFNKFDPLNGFPVHQFLPISQLFLLIK